MDINQLKTSLLKGDPEFWAQLKALTRSARDFEELFLLSSLRKKAHARRLENPAARKVEGAGLGLTIARMLAAKNDAELVLSNHPDGGVEALLILSRGLRPNHGFIDWAARIGDESGALIS